MTDDPPCRPNVGVAPFKRDGCVLIAKRTGDDWPDIVVPGQELQMPQGGVDDGEDLEAAARREPLEETGVLNVTVFGAVPDWRTDDFPSYAGPPHRLAAFRGQRRRWFAMRFEGDESEIDVPRSIEGAPPESSDWRWAPLRGSCTCGPVKRAICTRLAIAFARFAA